MSTRDRRALAMMHQQVQQSIDNVGGSPRPYWVRMSQIKRLRLSIKERLRIILEDGREVELPRSVALNVKRQSSPASLGSDA
jgi:hypothetical protein